MMFNENLRESKTIKEVLERIDHLFFQRVLFFLIFVWVISPILTMGINITNIMSSSYFQLTLLQQVGYIGLFFSIIYSIKLYNEQKDTFNIKSWSIQHLPELLLLAMLIWSFLSALLSDYRTQAFIGHHTLHEGFLTYLAYAGVFLSVRLLNKEYIKKLIDSFIIVSTILSFLTILQAFKLIIPGFSQNIGYAAIYFNYNHYGYYLSLASLASYSYFVTSNKKVLSLIFYIINISALIINNTMGSYLSVLISIIICTVIFNKIYQKSLKTLIFPLLLFVILSVSWNMLLGNVTHNFYLLSNDLANIINQNDDIGSAGSGRWRLWKSALDFIKEKPLFGYGPDTLDHPYIRSGSLINIRPHNEYLQHAASLGIPALILYLLSLIIILKRFVTNPKSYTIINQIALTAVLAYLGSAFFGNTKFYVTPYFLLFLASTFPRISISTVKEQKRQNL